jgi:hypothetical protein
VLDEGTVVVGVGPYGKRLIEVLKRGHFQSPFREYLRVPEADSDHSSSDPLELRAALAANGGGFQAQLGQCYRQFRERLADVRKMRYLLLCHLSEPPGLALPLELVRIIHRFHQETVLPPGTVEGFFAIPALTADATQKGRCYGFLKELNAFQSSDATPRFDFAWLIAPQWLCSDEAQIPEYVGELLSLYLATHAYSDFNACMATVMSHEKLADQQTCYSTLGMHRLVFPAMRWVVLLGRTFERRILSLPSLSPTGSPIGRVRQTLVHIADFNQDAGLSGEASRVVATAGRLENLGRPVYRPACAAGEGLVAPVESLERPNRRPGWLTGQHQYRYSDAYAEFYYRLDRATDEKVDAAWGRGMRQYAGLFIKRARARTEEILDSEGQGAFAALDFVRFLGEIGWLETAARRALERRAGRLPELASVSNHLLGWVGDRPSAMLDVVRGEMTRELQRLCTAHGLPVNPISTWDDAWAELEQIVESPASLTALGSDENRVRELNRIAERVRQARETPWTAALTASDVQGILESLESTGSRELRELVDRQAALDAAARAPAPTPAVPSQRLNWFQRFLRALGIRRRGPGADRKPQILPPPLPPASLVAIRERLLPCYMLLRLHAVLLAQLRPIQEEVSEFCVELERGRQRLDRSIAASRFLVSPITTSVPEKEEKDINFLYQFFQRTDTRSALDEAYEFVDAEHRLSLFYRRDARLEFFAGIRRFTRLKFIALRDWHAGRVILTLDRAQHDFQTLESSCVPFLKTEALPEGRQRSCLYIGLNEAESGQLVPDIGRYMGPAHHTYSTNVSGTISALRIRHGFPLFAVEGMLDFYRCYRESVKVGTDSYALSCQSLPEIIPAVMPSGDAHIPGTSPPSPSIPPSSTVTQSQASGAPLPSPRAQEQSPNPPDAKSGSEFSAGPDSDQFGGLDASQGSATT